MYNVTLYADGACKHNPGKGGYAAVLIYESHIKELAGNCPHTTNNRMELTAAIAGFKALQHPCRVTVYSDSQYLIHTLNKQWYKRWLRNDWQGRLGPVANRDLWEELFKVTELHTVTWCWVKGKSKDRWNRRAHTLAAAAMKKLFGSAVQARAN
jgi:ribonuclease HI